MTHPADNYLIGFLVEAGLDLHRFMARAAFCLPPQAHALASVPPSQNNKHFGLVRRGQ